MAGPVRNFEADPARDLHIPGRSPACRRKPRRRLARAAVIDLPFAMALWAVRQCRATPGSAAAASRCHQGGIDRHGGIVAGCVPRGKGPMYGVQDHPDRGASLRRPSRNCYHALGRRCCQPWPGSAAGAASKQPLRRRLKRSVACSPFTGLDDVEHYQHAMAASHIAFAQRGRLYLAGIQFRSVLSSSRIDNHWPGPAGVIVPNKPSVSPLGPAVK
jgi:hypothetical protein